MPSPCGHQGWHRAVPPTLSDTATASPGLWHGPAGREGGATAATALPLGSTSVPKPGDSPGSLAALNIPYFPAKTFTPRK